MKKTNSTNQSVAARLHAHLSGDGVYTDSETGDLYAEAHGLEGTDEVDSDDIAKWAVETAQSYALKHSNPLSTASPATAQHTPGPWTAKDQFIYAGGAIIAEAYHNTTSRPNARLIASAPELLAVCIAIEAYATTLGAGLLEQLRAAIAKANH